MLLLWNNKIYEIKYYLWVLSEEWVEKYQRWAGLLSRLVSVTKGRGTVMKRTHFKYSTVPKEVAYPPTIEQRTFTPVRKLFYFHHCSLHASNVRWKARPFLTFRELLTLCLLRGFSLAFVIAHVCYLLRKSVFVRPLPNADILSSDWFMRLWEGHPFSFEKILVIILL